MAPGDYLIILIFVLLFASMFARGGGASSGTCRPRAGRYTKTEKPGENPEDQAPPA